MNTLKITLLGIVAINLCACNKKDTQADASGIFEATEVIVSAKGNGEIKRLELQEGQVVEAEAELGYIDTTQLFLKKVQLQASLQAMDSRKTNVSRQTAALQQQITTQKREQQRFETLVAQNAANQKQLDDITAALATLEKQLAAQNETLTLNNSGVSNEQRSLLAQIAQLNDQLDNSVICSPIKGIILGKYVEAGEWTTQGKPLFKVADLANMYLRAYITASQLTTVKIGDSVTVYADKGQADSKSYQGTVTWVSDKAEFTPKTIPTRDERANLVYAVKIAVKNDGYIKNGMYGEVKFQ